jgi:hypothetical protein
MEHISISIVDTPVQKIMSEEEICNHAMDAYFGSNGEALRTVLGPHIRPRLSDAEKHVFRSHEDLVKTVLRMKELRRSESASSESSSEDAGYQDAIHDIVVSSLEAVLNQKQQEVESFAAQMKSNLRDKKVIIALLTFGGTCVASGTALSLAFGSC